MAKVNTYLALTTFPEVLHSNYPDRITIWTGVISPANKFRHRSSHEHMLPMLNPHTPLAILQYQNRQQEDLPWSWEFNSSSQFFNSPNSIAKPFHSTNSHLSCLPMFICLLIDLMLEFGNLMLKANFQLSLFIMLSPISMVEWMGGKVFGILLFCQEFRYSIGWQGNIKFSPLISWKEEIIL